MRKFERLWRSQVSKVDTWIKACTAVDKQFDQKVCCLDFIELYKYLEKIFSWFYLKKSESAKRKL